MCYNDLEHPDRDASIGKTNQPHGFRHPVRDASLTGCKGQIWISVSTERPSLAGCLLRVVFSRFLICRVGRYAHIGSVDTPVSGRSIRPYRVGRHARIGMFYLSISIFPKNIVLFFSDKTLNGALFVERERERERESLETGAIYSQTGCAAFCRARISSKFFLNVIPRNIVSAQCCGFFCIQLIHSNNPIKLSFL